MLTVVMYHYVRDMPKTRYPGIRGLLTSNFIGQLDYILKHYTVVGMAQCIDFVSGKGELPPNACLLTFDDGLLDDYLTVLPLLHERSIPGAFFVPVSPIMEGRVLDVHKIQHILALTDDYDHLRDMIFSLIEPFRKGIAGETQTAPSGKRYDIPSNDELYAEYAKPYMGYDPPEIGFVKRILQKGLPAGIRRTIVDGLFCSVVTNNEEAFAKELYMDLPQIKTMTRMGMAVGAHGYSHDRLGLLPEEEQRKEIEMMISFLSKICGGNVTNWTLSYPHGSRNERTLRLLEEYGCALAFANDGDLVSDLKGRRFSLPRLDTIDLPFSEDSPVSEWTSKVKNMRG